MNEQLKEEMKSEVKKLFDEESKKAENKLKKLSAYGGIITPVVVAVLGIIFTLNNSIQEKRNRDNAMATQLMAERERAETDFRQLMFEPLIAQILNESSPLDKRMTTFKLFQNNFNDLFNSRALFDALADTAQKLIDKCDLVTGPRIMRELISLARETNESQGLLLGVNGSHLIIDSVWQGLTVDTFFIEEKDESRIFIKEPDTLHSIIIIIDSVKHDYIKVKIEFPKENLKLNNGKEIKVSYFDSPLTDNILLPDGDRIAVVLVDLWEVEDPLYCRIDTSTAPKKAKIKIIHFPAGYVTAGYRPSINRVNDLINEAKEHSH